MAPPAPRRRTSDAGAAVPRARRPDARGRARRHALADHVDRGRAGDVPAGAARVARDRLHCMGSRGAAGRGGAGRPAVVQVNLSSDPAAPLGRTPFGAPCSAHPVRRTLFGVSPMRAAGPSTTTAHQRGLSWVWTSVQAARTGSLWCCCGRRLGCTRARMHQLAVHRGVVVAWSRSPWRAPGELSLPGAGHQGGQAASGSSMPTALTSQPNPPRPCGSSSSRA